MMNKKIFSLAKLGSGRAQMNQNLLITKFSKFSSVVSKASLFDDLMNHGFLPNQKPLISLPNEFQEINDLITNMTFWQKDGTASGLLAKDLFRKTVDNEFPDLMAKIIKTDPEDSRLNAALLRDY
jgi:hypothetical protein